MATTACSECKGEFEASQMIPLKGRLVCSDCKPIVLQKISEDVSDDQYEVAGFGSRVGAVLIDFAILFSLGLISQLVFAVIHIGGAADILNQLVGIAYYIYFVGTFGQTPGKMAFKIKIINFDGSEKISYPKAVGRYFAGILSAIPLGIGYLMPLWDKQYGRALHDRVCSTRVVKVKR